MNKISMFPILDQIDVVDLHDVDIWIKIFSFLMKSILQLFESYTLLVIRILNIDSSYLFNPDKNIFNQNKFLSLSLNL